MDYAALIPIAAYVLAVQLATRSNAHPALTTSVAVLLPWVVSLVVRYIFESGYGAVSLTGFFSLHSLLLLGIQLLSGLIIFTRLRDEETIAAMIAWAVGGFVVLLFLLPYIVGLLPF